MWMPLVMPHLHRCSDVNSSVVHCLRPAASSIAKEQGSAIAFSIGLWFLFTLLWVLFTTLLAALNGVAVGDTQDQGYLVFEGRLICFLQTESITIFWKPDWTGDRGVSALGAYLAAILWTIVPVYLFQRRLNRLVP